MKQLFLISLVSMASVVGQSQAQNIVLNNNSEIIFNPTSTSELLTVNRPNQYPGAMPYTVWLTNFANGDGTYNSPLVSGFNPYGWIDPTQSGIYYSLEPDYRPSGARYKEAHLEVSLPDGTQSRLYSSTFVEGKSLALSSNQWDFRASQMYISPLIGNPYLAIGMSGVGFYSPDGSNGWRFAAASNAGETYLLPSVGGAQTLRLLNWANVDVRSTVNAAAYAVAGTAGLSITKMVKGSDGKNCTMTFTSGLLTATSCP